MSQPANISYDQYHSELFVPLAVQNRLKSWFRLFWSFTIIHYVVGIGGVLASTISASLSKDDKGVWSIIAAVCMAIIGFVKPDSSYQKYVKAWRLLDKKVNEYKFGLISIKELLEGMSQGEDEIQTFRKEADEGNVVKKKNPQASSTS